MKKTSIINLQDYRPIGNHSRVIAGAARGIEVREASRIDELEAESEEVIIHVPEDMGAVTPSFLEEFLLHVVLKLREPNFFKKFKFENNGYYKIKRDVDEAIDRILREDEIKRMLREDEDKRRLRREEKEKALRH